MADRPILFSAPMVRALLAGTKVQTRRALKPQPVQNSAGLWCLTLRGNYRQGEEAGIPDFYLFNGIRFAVGDRLWVRETWRTIESVDGLAPSGISASRPIFYEADDLAQAGRGKLRASIHRPRWASRLTLTVSDVRVQRLQDISPEDAQAEGVERRSRKVRQINLFGASAEERDRQYLNACVWEYEELWDSLNGAGAWAANPWVAAISFEAQRANINNVRPLPQRREWPRVATPEEVRRQVAFEHKVVTIYKCLRDCGMMDRIFQYAIDPRAIFCCPAGAAFGFDIREQIGATDRLAGKLCHSETHRAVIVDAIDAGALVMWSDTVPQVAS